MVPWCSVYRSLSILQYYLLGPFQLTKSLSMDKETFGGIVPDISMCDAWCMWFSVKINSSNKFFNFKTNKSFTNILWNKPNLNQNSCFIKIKELPFPTERGSNELKTPKAMCSEGSGYGMSDFHIFHYFKNVFR